MFFEKTIIDFELFFQYAIFFANKNTLSTLR